MKPNPNAPGACNNLGSIYKDLGDTEKAIEYFKEALRIKPDYDRARMNLGMTYAMKGDFESALSECELLHKSNARWAAELHSQVHSGEQKIP